MEHFIYPTERIGELLSTISIASATYKTEFIGGPLSDIYISQGFFFNNKSKLIGEPQSTIYISQGTFKQKLTQNVRFISQGKFHQQNGTHRRTIE